MASERESDGPRDIAAQLDEIRRTQKALHSIVDKQMIRLERVAASMTRQEWRELLRGIPHPQRLEHSGQKVYSQNEEDGIIAEIFRRLAIDPASGMFIEFGVENGIESNTHFLLRKGFRGVWLDGSDGRVEGIQARFHHYVKTRQLTVRHLFVTAENIDAELAGLEGKGKVALLSIDVDGNDYWIWKAITSIQPAVVVIEYNGKYPPPLAVAQRYRADRVWKGTDDFGASLSAMAKLGQSKGYSLVGCNTTGMNAFFVRNDLVQQHFPYELTAENLYHPCRYELTYGCFASAGHRPDVGRFEFV